MTTPRDGQRRSGLVEEALLDEPSLLLGRDLDVARGEQEGLLGDLLHPAVEGVGEAGGEVDQPLGELAVGGLQVEDHRDGRLEPVGDLLGVVEASRGDEVDLDVGAAVAADRLQHPAAGRLVVGEDVVDLVARAAALGDPADRGRARRGAALVDLPVRGRVGLVQVVLAGSQGPRRGRSRRARGAMCLEVPYGCGVRVESRDSFTRIMEQRSARRRAFSDTARSPGG